MAILKPSIVGTFNGKIGEAVLTTWKDLYVGRSLPTKSKKPPTAAQLDQRLKFGLVTGFFSNISDIIAIGYRSDNGGITEMNAAVKAGLKTLIMGVSPNYTLDLTKVIISNPKSKVAIDGGFAPIATAIAGSKVTVSWIAEEESDADVLTKPTDLAYLVFYSTNKERFVTFKAKAQRSLLTTTATVPRSFVGDKFHGYLFFVSADGKMASLSDYIGQFTLIA